MAPFPSRLWPGPAARLRAAEVLAVSSINLAVCVYVLLALTVVPPLQAAHGRAGTLLGLALTFGVPFLVMLAIRAVYARAVRDARAERDARP